MKDAARPGAPDDEVPDHGPSPLAAGRVEISAGSDRRYLWIAFGLVVGFMAVEVAVAAVSGSLALLADAGHMLTDAGAIAAAIWAAGLATRPATQRWTYGLKRAEILSAAANGVTLLVVGALVAYDAVGRLISPPPVEGLALLVVALVGVGVNFAATWVLGRANHSSLNVHGVFRHIVTDLYAFIASAAAGAVILATGFRAADPIASLVVVAVMARTAWGLLKASGKILLQGTPESVDLARLRAHLASLPEVVSVHDLHAWTLSSELPVVSAHVVVSDPCLADGGVGPMLDRLQACLVGHFDVGHSTFQLEPVTHADHEGPAHE